jgi:hypothetical protein
MRLNTIYKYLLNKLVTKNNFIYFRVQGFDKSNIKINSACWKVLTYW